MDAINHPIEPGTAYLFITGALEACRCLIYVIDLSKEQMSYMQENIVLRSIFFNFSRFIFANNSENNKEGHNELKKLSESASYNQIITAAIKTLQSNKL